MLIFEVISFEMYFVDFGEQNWTLLAMNSNKQLGKAVYELLITVVSNDPNLYFIIAYEISQYSFFHRTKLRYIDCDLAQ